MAGTAAAGRARWQAFDLAVFIAALLPFITLSFSELLGAPRRGLPIADLAVLELQLRQLTQAPILLGPYSRFGWNHPGPALLYLLLPWYAVSRGSSGGLYIGATVINTLSAAGCLLLLRRLAPSRGAYWACAVLILLYLGYLTPPTIASPWNPYAVLMPLLLLFLAATALIAGGGNTLRMALVGLATLIVQSHLGYAPVVLAVIVAGAALRLRLRRAGQAKFPSPSSSGPQQKPRRRGARLAFVFLGAVTLVMWIGPLVEQFQPDGGNVMKLWRYFRDQPASLQRQDLVAQAFAREFASLPLQCGGIIGSPFPDRDHDVVTRSASSIILAVAAGQLCLLFASLVRGWRSRCRSSVGLAALSLLGAAIAPWSLAHIPGGMHRYLVIWVSIIGLVSWIAIANTWLVMPAISRWSAPAWVRRIVVGLAVAGLMALAGIRSYDAATRAIVTDRRSDSVGRVLSQLEEWRSRHVTERILVRIADADAWPKASGVLLALSKRGAKLAIEDAWLFMFGRTMVATGEERSELIFDAAGAPAGVPRDADGVLLASDEGLCVRWRALAASELPQGRIRFGAGWGPREPWGRWALEREAHLRIFPAAAYDTLVVSAASFEQLVLPQRCVVEAAGRPIGEYVVAGRPWTWEQHRIALVGRCETPDGCDVTLRFERRDRAAGGQDRLRALPFQSIQLASTIRDARARGGS